MKILIVDDHALIREALRSVLRSLVDAPAVIEASLAAEALQLAAGHPDLDLILLDLSLPDRDGMAILAELRECRPGAAVVVLSARQDRAEMLAVIQLGASGYIPKSASRDVMVGALNLVLSGGVYVPPEAIGIAGAAAAARSPSAVLPPATDLGLTPRQHDVLRLMLQGKSNKAICRSLDLAEPTVKNHVSAILKVLDVGSRTEAVVAAWALMKAAAPANGRGSGS